MAKELKHIDISKVSELLRIVEDMRASNEPRVLQRDHEDSGRVVLAPGAIVAIIEDFRVVLAAWWTFRHLIRLRRVG